MQDERIIQKGITALQDALFEGYTFWGYEWLPYRYSIDGIVFEIYTYLNLRGDCDGMGLSFTYPVYVDLLDEDNLLAVRAAFWLYHQIDHLNDALMFIGKYGVDKSRCDNTSEGLHKYFYQLADIKRMYIYPYLPSWIWSQVERSMGYCATFILEALEREKAERRAEMRQSPTYGFVYLIQSPTGSYKIGRTRNPNNRMRTFGVQLPFEVDYVCVIETGDMYQLERQLHQQFANKRINGEWFLLDAQDVASIQGMAVSS